MKFVIISKFTFFRRTLSSLCKNFIITLISVCHSLSLKLYLYIDQLILVIAFSLSFEIVFDSWKEIITSILDTFGGIGLI